jgi:predicted nucleic acid-binding protein
MPVEPGVVDANVLVYAFDMKAHQHVASRTLLDAGRTGATTLYVTLQVLCEFYSIVTNARRVLKPRSSTDALAAISDILGFLRVLPVPVTAIDEVMALLQRRPVTGGEIFDLQIVATMKLNGISRIYTFNTDDFGVFPELTVVNPARV